jgi:short subunit dehydrogenase-like uncharacterized protein
MTAVPGRNYDLVLLGATGFVGRLAASYLAHHADTGRLAWAIAGRDRNKLEAVRANCGSMPDVVLADTRDPASLDRLAASARVLATTAGPFDLYGGPVVDACVRARTHYLDITGETVWVKGLIDRYHERAAAEGTRIVPCCGFDSVPSDLGSFLLVRHLQEKLHARCLWMKAYFKAYGGWNGGTLASKMHNFDSGQWERSRDSHLLDPAGASSGKQIERDRDVRGVLLDGDIGTWVGPFFMAPTNTRVVRRSAALYAEWGSAYGPDFVYQEYLRYDAPLAKIKAVGVTAILAMFDRALEMHALRRLVMPLLPKPGQGPSAGTMEKGWFTCELLARTDDGRLAHARLRDRGDPANRVTVKCLCESALTVAIDAAALPGGPARGGVLTPATALGEPLAARLRKARGCKSRSAKRLTPRLASPNEPDRLNA